ncbi:MAG: alpha/beta hydrolase [Rhodanobacteraceae bacterium]
MPFSSYASPQARRIFQRVVDVGRRAPPPGEPIAIRRGYYDAINSARADLMRRRHPVTIQSLDVGGVPVQWVAPKQRMTSASKDRVLVNLHGGAFLWGAGSGGLVESIPVASLSRTSVITVDYRQGPEHVFPAACEDVATVYRGLLDRYPAKNIGIYGNSAGGVLTAECVAWFLHARLPLPGAIGTLCGSVAELDGDSVYVAPALVGTSTSLRSFMDLPYFRRADPSDPLVFPANSPALLARFPPTLLVTGTRDYTMSSVLKSQRLLVNAGVNVELHVWDGMWHSFFVDAGMPETDEVYAVVARFFDKHLGR